MLISIWFLFPLVKDCKPKNHRTKILWKQTPILSMNIHKLKPMMSMANFTLQEKVLQRWTVFSSFFVLATVLQSISSLWRKRLQRYNRSQSPHWNIYVLHKAGLPNRGAVLDLLHVSEIKQHTALWKSQGLNLSCSVISLRKPISSSPSSEWLISLHLHLTRLAGT